MNYNLDKMLAETVVFKSSIKKMQCHK